METYQDLLRLVGFPAADANARVARSQRDLNRGLSDLALAGEEEREAIDADAESRGVYNSGQRLMNRANQVGREGGAVADLYTAYADDVAAVDQQMIRERANAEAANRVRAAERGIRETDYGAELELLRRSGEADMASILNRWNIDMSAIESARRANSISRESQPTLNTALLSAAGGPLAQPKLNLNAVKSWWGGDQPRGW